ncbi:MAG: hypothetical protein ABMA26_14510, partial [Limisphaerales bacterium]
VIGPRSVQKANSYQFSGAYVLPAYAAFFAAFTFAQRFFAPAAIFALASALYFLLVFFAAGATGAGNEPALPFNFAQRA